VAHIVREPAQHGSAVQRRQRVPALADRMGDPEIARIVRRSEQIALAGVRQLRAKQAAGVVASQEKQAAARKRRRFEEYLTRMAVEAPTVELREAAREALSKLG
jgi:hypothetical protein